jgi:hypothetical protein
MGVVFRSQREQEAQNQPGNSRRVELLYLVIATASYIVSNPMIYAGVTLLIHWADAEDQGRRKLCLVREDGPDHRQGSKDPDGPQDAGDQEAVDLP